MPQGLNFSVDDPFQYQAAIRGADVKTVVSSKGVFHAELQRIDLFRLWMQRSDEVAPRVSHAANGPDRAPIFFLTRANQGSMHHSGMEVTPLDIVVYSPAASHYHWTSGPSSWGSMSLSQDDLASVGYAIAGRELAMPVSTRLLRPTPAKMARLATLHASVGTLVKSTPGVLAGEVAHALENALLHAMIGCLDEGPQSEMTSGDRRHRAILGRFEEFLANNRDRPLYLAEICAAVGTSERTLRLSCQKHLGMGPIHYLWLRRMYLTHRALLLADHTAATVTEIAMNHGFWELGRFAVEYRRVFAESPSETLKRPAQERRPFRGSPFALSDSESA